MQDLLNVAGKSTACRYDWKPSISYRKGELSSVGRNIYLNLIEGNLGLHPMFSQTWQCIGRINEIGIDMDEWEAGDYLTATSYSTVEYITCLTIDGLKRIKCKVI